MRFYILRLTEKNRTLFENAVISTQRLHSMAMERFKVMQNSLDGFDDEDNFLGSLQADCALYERVQHFLRSFASYLNKDRSAIILNLPFLDQAKFDFKNADNNITNLLSAFSKETNNSKKNPDIRKKVMLKNAFELLFAFEASKENQDPIFNQPSSNTTIKNNII